MPAVLDVEDYENYVKVMIGATFNCKQLLQHTRYKTSSGNMIHTDGGSVSYTLGEWWRGGFSLQADRLTTK